MKKRILLSMVLLFLISNCVKNRIDYKPEDVSKKNGTIFGEIEIDYNGMQYEEHCTLIFESDKERSFKLDETGIIIFPIKAGPVKFKQVNCLDMSIYHYEFENIKFNVAQQPAITYIGYIRINWKTRGGTKPSAMFGLVGGLADIASSDGEIDIKLESDPEFTTKYFTKHYPDFKPLKVKTSLLDLSSFKKKSK